MLAPEDLKQIVDAIEQLDWVQAIKQLLTTEAAEETLPAGPAIAPPAAPPAGPIGEPAAGPPVVPAGPPAAPPVEPPAEEPEKKKFAAASTNLDEISDEDLEKYVCDRKAKKYAAEAAESGSVDGKASPKPEGGDAEGATGSKPDTGSIDGKVKYSALQAKLDKLTAERYALANAARREVLNRIRYHRVFDVDKEVKRCEFQAMDDEHFNEHCDTIIENYARTSAGDGMPIPIELFNKKQADATPTSSEREKYSKEVVEKAVRYVQDQKTIGRVVLYDTVLENLAAGKPAEATA